MLRAAPADGCGKPLRDELFEWHAATQSGDEQQVQRCRLQAQIDGDEFVERCVQWGFPSSSLIQGGVGRTEPTPTVSRSSRHKGNDRRPSTVEIADFGIDDSYWDFVDRDPMG